MVFLWTYCTLFGGLLTHPRTLSPEAVSVRSKNNFTKIECKDNTILQYMQIFLKKNNKIIQFLWILGEFNYKIIQYYGR